MDNKRAGEDSKNDSFSGCLVRFAWMAVANMAMFFAAIHVIQKPAAALSWGDAGLVAAVVFSVAARYVDVRFFAGETTEGVPATMRDWRLHALRMLAFGAGVAVLAHAVAATGWFS